jgi:hypothetical protein
MAEDVSSLSAGEKRAVNGRGPPVLVTRASVIIAIRKATLDRWIGVGHD